MNKKTIITILLALVAMAGLNCNVFHLAFSLRHPQDHQHNPQRDHFRQRLAPDLTKALYLG
ncbi:MAG: hypothetical protein IKQ59_15645 [Prevotella sp.]|nr:hypothetical protein [Prevotella sp.]